MNYVIESIAVKARFSADRSIIHETIDKDGNDNDHSMKQEDNDDYFHTNPRKRRLGLSPTRRSQGSQRMIVMTML